MQLYSTKNKGKKYSLKEAVIQGLADDNGLFMPDTIPTLRPAFYDTISKKSLPEISYEICQALFQDEIPADELQRIVTRAINFDAPIVSLTDSFFSLELFHGPTLAFKDFGARFMAELLTYFTKDEDRKIRILVATSGDTGSAVANSFLDNEKIDVIILYPSGKVSYIQEKQLTTLGNNISALEVKGSFDDCQSMVKAAFLDPDLKKLNLSSANSINIARLIPQSFYYFYAYSRLPDAAQSKVIFSVPSGNFGNLTAGLLAKRMGLPVHKFIASTNLNDTVPNYLSSGIFNPKPSVETISNAMDVGNPSNFVRMSDLFNSELSSFKKEISGYAFSDDETKKAINEMKKQFSYVADPHGAVAYLGLKEYFTEMHDPKLKGILLETAHPAKFLDVVESEIKEKVQIPPRLKACLELEKKSKIMENDYQALKAHLLSL